ncbi:MAG: ISAzo13 family transposase [Planctomycetota bacterium]
MTPTRAGDPMTGLKWTRKTTDKVSRELKRAGIVVGARTVARLLTDLDYRLRVNHKKLSRGSAARRSERNRQFGYIQALRQSFLERGDPVISVDTKKKEMVGLFKNPGAAWGKTATPVLDHDFRSDAKAMTVPYGVLDLGANRGHMFVGTSHDTSQYAVSAVTRWWKVDGQPRYPHANRLLILADNGGSNGSRRRGWKYELHHKLCNPHDLEVTVCHFPSGASKWNPIEHLLFSQVSKNWAGEPLVNLETMLNFMRTTRTEKGLRVRATLVNGNYPTGIKVAAEAMASVNIIPHDVLPAWNYTIAPGAPKM